MSEESIKARRAELLVEGFLYELNPPHIAQVEGDNLGFDFVIAFKKPDRGLKYCAIEIKATENLVAETFHFMTGRRFLEARKSNMPMVILVADTKRNELYYGFASEAEVVNAAHRAGFYGITLPVSKIGQSSAAKREFIDDILAAK
jgi:hypothetical protein